MKNDLKLIFKSGINKLLFSGLIILLITGCVISQPPYKSYEFYESVKKSGAIHYPKYHPGDLLAHKGFWKSGSGYMIQDFWDECKKKCTPTFNCENKPPLSEELESCQKKYDEDFKICTDSCHEAKLKTASISKHIEGGYYSDGSYCAITYWNVNYYFFINLHPTRMKYKKTKWQKDRDECMEITAENVDEGGFLSRGTYFKRSTEYYQNCLKERGYDIN